jgi:CheY-like chemotaxis protein
VKALVVDDDSVVRLILRQVLQRHLRAAVTEATNGAEALALLEHHTFDLTVLDLRMPEVDGLSVLMAIRTSEAHSDMPVVILTGDRKDEYVVHAIRLGVSDYLTKPIKGKEIAERLAHAVAQREHAGTYTHLDEAAR